MPNLTAVLWLVLAVTLSGCIQDAPSFSQADGGNEAPLRGATSTGELDGGPSEGLIQPLPTWARVRRPSTRQNRQYSMRGLAPCLTLLQR